MIYLSEQKPFKVYKQPIMFSKGINPNRRKGNSVFLLTPNIESSIGLINSNLLKLNKSYNNYYIERDVSFYVNKQNNVLESMITPINVRKVLNGESLTYLNESGNFVTEEQWVTLDGTPQDIQETSQYLSVESFTSMIPELLTLKLGLFITLSEEPDIIQNKYNKECNLNSFSCYPARCINPEDREMYYKSIISKIIMTSIKDYPDSIKDKVKDINKEYIFEGESPFTTIKRNITRSINKGGNRKLDNIVDDIVNGAKGKSNIDSDSNITPSTAEDIVGQIKGSVPTIEYYNSYFNSDEPIIEQDMIFVGEMVTYFNEAKKEKQDSKLYKILYKERIKNNKELFVYYDYIKASTNNIQNTYINYNRYKGYNIYIDLFYYNELFFKNNIYKLDRGIDLYQAFLYRAMNNDNYLQSEYSRGNRTIIIPVKDWMDNIKTKSYLYNRDINPISLITRLLQKDSNMLKELFGKSEVVFMTNNAYFKVVFNDITGSDYTLFINTLKKLYHVSSNSFELDDIDNTNSKSAIVDKIIDDIEDSQGIKMSNLTGSKSANDNETLQNIQSELDKKELIDKIEKAADTSASLDDTLDKLDEDEEFKKLLMQLSDTEENGVVINASRLNRMSKLNDEFLEKKINNRSVKDLLATGKGLSKEEIKPISLPIDSVNKEWQNLVYPAMNAQYNPDIDIVAMLNDLYKMSYPIAIRDIEIVDTSTSEDYVYTYIVDMENHTGKRFKFKFDIPKLINSQYMKLKGNKKSISTQSFLMPVLKTEEDTAQIVTNYNKIFVYRYGMQTGKSTPASERLVKALNKQEYKNIKITIGNNTNMSMKYDLPIEYVDLSGIYNRIDTADGYSFIFNYRQLLEEIDKLGLKIDLKMGTPYGIFNSGKVKHIVYFCPNKSKGEPLFLSSHIAFILSSQDIEFSDVFKSTKTGVKQCYSQASILSSKIPVIILLGYNGGLSKALDLAKIPYKYVEKKDRFKESTLEYGYIAFSDGYLEYEESVEASLLLNGLRESDTKAYSVTDVNKKSMFLELLDKYTERIKTDGLENFADCLVDSITRDTCEHYNLPDNYNELLIYANNLLVDNKFVSHSTQEGRRLRRNELISAYFYKALSGAYGSYATSYRHGRETILSMKQSAVIDLLMQDPSQQDLSILNALREKEAYDLVTTKGLSGMNSDRSYSLDKRSYDESMTNVLSMSTGFAGTVGINRQATINANVDTVRGYIKPLDKESMGSVNTLCMSEALTPMGSTRDDPFRTAMTYIQTTNHGVRVRVANPLLISNGADKALPYLISDIFAWKAKENGEIIEFEEDSHIIIKYSNGKHDFIDLSPKIEKNSSSGFYIVLKLDTDFKLGDKIKKGEIVAYDRESFNRGIGLDNQHAYNIGTLCMGAIMTTDEGFEDSALINNTLSECLATTVVDNKDISLDKNTNVYNILPPGTRVDEGDILMNIQRPYDEEDANALLKLLAIEEDEVSQLGRIPIKSPISGVIENISIRRTCELNDMSESLRDLCKKYESKTKTKRSSMKKYSIDKEYELDPDYKLEATGRLKDVPDGVKITFSISYYDKMGIGDKLIYWSANKGEVKGIIDDKDTPYLMGQPNKKLGCIISVDAINNRMVDSIANNGVLNRLLIELGWKCKEMAGIEVDYSVPSLNDLTD